MNGIDLDKRPVAKDIKVIQREKLIKMVGQAEQNTNEIENRIRIE